MARHANLRAVASASACPQTGPSRRSKARRAPADSHATLLAVVTSSLGSDTVLPNSDPTLAVMGAGGISIRAPACYNAPLPRRQAKLPFLLTSAQYNLRYFHIQHYIICGSAQHCKNNRFHLHLHLLAFVEQTANSQSCCKQSTKHTPSQYIIWRCLRLPHQQPVHLHQPHPPGI
jgi:hypothetical protein